MELIEQVINRQNMMRALNQVKQNKGSAGVDRMPVSELYDYLTNNRESIEQSLLNGTYLPQPILEKYFRAKWIESRQFSDIGNYWDRKGGNEIDLVAINEMEERIVFCEIKRNKKKINLSQLQTKSASCLQIYPQFNASYQALSLDDM